MATIVCIGPCGETKNQSEFYGNSHKCKVCTLARQKELKEAKANGTAAPAKGKSDTRKASKASRKAAPPQAASAALTMPAGLGLSASVNEETNDIVLAQTTSEATATIWLSRYEAQQLAVFIAGLSDPA